MPMPDTRSRQRLAAMGIEVWVRREQFAEPAVAELTSATKPADTGLRIRMASGSGDWLLVQREPWAGTHEKLLADITATVGADRCRFGQWAVSDSAGVPVDELASRGIRFVLAFGVPPREVGQAAVHQAPALDDLATSAKARRRLWHLLAPLVAS